MLSLRRKRETRKRIPKISKPKLKIQKERAHSNFLNSIAFQLPQFDRISTNQFGDSPNPSPLDGDLEFAAHLEVLEIRFWFPSWEKIRNKAPRKELQRMFI
jgi:hypothetical protein